MKMKVNTKKKVSKNPKNKALKQGAVIRWRHKDADKLAKKLFSVGVKAAQKERPDLIMHDWDGLQDHIKIGHLAVAKYMIRSIAACV
jgi:hypothetical protein